MLKYTLGVRDIPSFLIYKLDLYQQGEWVCPTSNAFHLITTLERGCKPYGLPSYHNLGAMYIPHRGRGCRAYGPPSLPPSHDYNLL